MRTRRKSIALFGLFGVGNVGNDASLLAMLRHLREALPDTGISCICGNPAKITEEYKIPSVSLYPERSTRKLSSSCQTQNYLQIRAA